MIGEIQGMLEAYHRWLKDKTQLRQIDKGAVEITTPYLDRHNDYVQIYAKQAQHGFVLTDDGYTIADLLQTGCSLDSPKRKDLLQTTLNGFGVQMADQALQVQASSASFASQKHNLIQAILAVNDIFYLATPMVASVFYEDVARWLDLHNIRWTPRAKFTGKSGYDHLFDFVIPKSRAQPERILKAINRPNRDSAQVLVFAWNDTREVRPADSRAYALLNDAESAVQSQVLDALRRYEIEAVPWSQREDVQEGLAA